MAVELAHAYINIVPSTRDIAPAINKALGDVDKMGAKAGQSLGDRIASSMSKTLKVGAASAGVAAGGVLAGSIAKGMGRLTSIDAAQQKLKGLGSTGEEVQGIMKNALAAVDGTAFGMGEAATVASQVVASGIKPGEELERVLKTVGDTAAITGDSMDSMGMIFGSVAARGKLMGDDLMQLRSRGLPVMDILAESLGKTTEEVEKMASNGEISFEIFETAMREKMGGAAQAMGETFQGSIKNVGAAMGRFGEQLMKPVFDNSPKVISATRSMFNEMTDAVKPLSAEMSEKLAPVAENVAGVMTDKIAPALGEATGKVGEFLLKMTDKAIDSGIWERLGTTFGTLGELFKQIWPDLEKLAESFGTITANVSIAVWEALINVLNAMVPLITSVLVPLVEQVAKLAEENPEAIQRLVLAFIGFKAMGTVVGPMKTFASTATDVGGAVKFLGTSFKGAGVAGGLVNVMAGFKNANPIIAAMGRGVASMTKVLSGVGKALRFINPWVAGITALVGALTWFFTKTETGQKVWENFTTALGNSIDWVKGKFESFTSFVGDTVGRVRDTVTTITDILFKGEYNGNNGLFGLNDEGGKFVDVLFRMRDAVISVKDTFTTITDILFKGEFNGNSGLFGLDDESSGFVNALFTIRDTVITVIDTVKAVISGTVTFIQEAFNAIVTAGQWMVQIIGTVVLTPFILLWEALSAAARWAWENGIKPTFDFIANAAVWLWQSVLVPAFEGIKAAFQAVGDFFMWVWNNLIKPAWDALGAAANWLWQSVLVPAFDGIKAAFQAVGDAFQWVWNNLIKPAFDAFAAGINWLWQNIVTPAVDGIKWLWDGLGNAFRWVYDNIIQPAFTAFGDGLNWLWNNVVSPVIGWIQDRWQQMGDGFNSVKSFVVDTVFGGLQSGLDTLKGWFKTAVDSITDTWNKVKSATAKPARFVVDTVYNKGILRAWNAVTRITGLKELEPADLGDLGSYARGGVLPGYTPGRDVYKMVDPVSGVRVDLGGGEAIMRPEFTAVMGAKSINALNKAARTGGKAAVAKMLGQGAQFAYAKGGIFPNGDTERKEDQSARIMRAVEFMKGEDGKPYQWGGVGNPSWDCSGLWSGIVHVLNGENGRSGRLFNTTSLMANPGRFGFERGLNGPITVGVSNDHMAGTLAGTNAESRGGDGVLWGRGAWGSEHGYFPNKYTLAAFLGEYLPGGAGGDGGGFSLAGMVKQIWDGIINGLPEYGETKLGEFAKVPGAMFKHMAEMAWNYIKEVVGQFFGSAGSAGDAESWREMAMWAMRRVGFNADDPRQVDAMLKQIMSESGGIPDRAQEIVDVNGTGASAGLGLLQIIPTTFADHRDPELPDDRTNPEANMVAALRYYKSRYGMDLTTMWGHGHGYATGGVLPGYTPGRDVHQFYSPTAGFLGLSGGEAIMVPEWTRAVGGPSAVAAMNKEARHGRKSGGRGFANGGVFGSGAGGDIAARFNRAVESLQGAADEINSAFHGDDWGYGELAAVLRNEEWAKSIVNGAAWLGKALDPTTLEGIFARSLATETVGIFGDLGMTQTATVTGALVNAEKSLAEARMGHHARLDEIAQKEEELAEARAALAEFETDNSQMSIKDARKLADAERALAEARQEAGQATTSSSRKVEDAEKALARAREDAADASGDKAEKAARKVADAEERLARAREDSAAAADKKSAKADAKVAKAEERLARVQEDLGIKADEDAAKRAEKQVKAAEEVEKAEQALADARKKSAAAMDTKIYEVAPQIFDTLSAASAKVGQYVPQAGAALAQLAIYAGPAGASVGMAVNALRTAINVAKEFAKVIDHVTGAFTGARVAVSEAVVGMMGSVVELSKMVQEQREATSMAVIKFGKAQMDVSAAMRNMRITAMDGVTAQLKGVKSLRDAQAAFDKHTKKNVSTWKGHYIDLTYSANGLYDQMQQNADAASDLLAEFDDEAMALLMDIEAAQADLWRLDVQARIDSLEAAFQYEQALLDSADALRELEYAAARFEIAAKQAFGFDVEQATVGQRYAQLASEKAQLQAEQASVKTWLNPVNWFTSMPQAQRRIKQIDDQMAEIAAMPEFKAFDANTVRQIDRMLGSATVMGLFGAGDKVPGMVNNSVLGDASRSLDQAKFETSLLDLKKSNEDLNASVQRAALEMAHRQKVEPLQSELKAAEMMIAHNQTMAEYWRSDSRAVRDALDALATNYKQNAGELQALAAKQREVVINVPAGKTAFDVGEVREMVKQFNDQVEGMKMRLDAQQNSTTGLDVSAMVRG